MQQTDLAKAVARARRRDAALADRLLWDALRNRRFLGLKVRRQVPLGDRIVAFYLPEPRLALDFAPAPDPLPLRLAGQGFGLLCLDRHSVAADLPGTLARIAAAIAHAPRH